MWFTDAEQKMWDKPGILYAIGMDEAGRGCMAGPVAVTAVLLRVSEDKMPFCVDDSKKLTMAVRSFGMDELFKSMGLDAAVWKQELMTRHYGVATPSVTMQSSSRVLAVSTYLQSSELIDELNISNAALEGMSAACSNVVEVALKAQVPLSPENTAVYVDGKVLPWTFLQESERMKILSKKKKKNADIQRVGKVHPALHGFPAKAIVDGDQKLYAVACASVVSKVVRDEYCVTVMDVQFPEYKFSTHKGYCTGKHRDLLLRHGACAFHRKSFGPVSVALGGHGTLNGSASKDEAEKSAKKRKVDETAMSVE